ncbi:MAG: NAD(P)H-binding protein, partial [Anaerolineae bacterium]|nr:NAD(P)H-binding protein [Anaerolineae bacterium]
MTILVLNSTGKVGQEIVRELHAANADYRAATGSLERAQSTWDFPAPAMVFSYDDRTTFAPVLQGVTRLFMLHPVDQPGRHHQLFAFIDAANVAGVKEIVFMSALGADLRPDDPLCLVEQYLARGAAYYTILRPNWFMQN